MDIAYYLSDLLGQQGELSVPNLGYFVQIRMPAYYDSEAKKFYPPHFSVQFDPQVIDEDDSLAAYITGLKKISLASAKYFIEKYISNLKNQAMIENVPFANLGSFHSDGIKLIFEPGVKTDAPAFFALHPVEAYHIGENIPVKEPVVTQDEPAPATYSIPQPEVEPEPQTEVPGPEIEQPFTFAPTPGVVYPENSETEYQPEAAYADDDVPTRSISVWTIILIILTAIAITFAGLYKFKPALFKNWFSLHKNPYTASQPIAPPAIKHDDTTTVKDSDSATAVTPKLKDTIDPKIKVPVSKVLTTPPAIKTPVKTVVSTPQKTTVTPTVNAPAKTVVSTPQKTTIAPTVKAPAKAVTNPPVKNPAPINVNAPVPDAIEKGWWVIYGGAFPVRSLADKAVSNYKSLGYSQARLLSTDVKRGNNYKVILGAYKTKAEATDASKEMLMTHKLTLSVEQIK